jgi:hypothetical protein
VRSHRTRGALFELGRTFRARFLARGDTADDAFDRRLHSESPSLENPSSSSFPGAARGGVFSLARRRCRVTARTSEEMGEGTERLEGDRCDETGGVRFTTRAPLRRSRSNVARGVVFRAAIERTSSDVSVASFAPRVRDRVSDRVRSEKAAEIVSTRAS